MNKTISVLLIISCFLALYKINKEFNSYEKQKKAQINAIDALLIKNGNNTCLNGKNKTQLTLDQELQEFIQGPCSPIILIPGLEATRLQVEIDCNKFAYEAPLLFKSCGWNACKRHFWNIFAKVPRPEYTIWIADPLSPFTIFEVSGEASCLGDIVELKTVVGEEGKVEFKSPPGIKISPYGKTNLTFAESECGVNSIGWLSTNPLMKLSTCATKGFSLIFDQLNDLGYTNAISYQAIPYDFRLPIPYSNAPNMIVKSIRNMYKLTGKRVIVMGHSLGTLNTLYTLNQLTKEEKDEMVEFAILAGSPYLGSPTALSNIIGGDASYVQQIGSIDIGISKRNQKLIEGTIGSVIDIIPKDSLFLYENTTWFQKIQDRITYEQQYLKYGLQLENPFDFFPDVDKECIQGQFGRTNKCVTGLFDMRKSSLQIKNKKKIYFDYQGLKKAAQYTYFPQQTLQNLEISKDSKLNLLTNPEVNTVFIYGAHTKLNSNLKYERDPKNSKDFIFSVAKNDQLSDGTVLTTSAIAAGVKWIIENKENQSNNTVQLYELCGTYNQDSPFFDSEDSTGRKTFSDNGYRGIGCQCKGKSNISSCKHACFLADPDFVHAIANLVINNQKSKYNASNYSLNELKSIVDSCQNLIA